MRVAVTGTPGTGKTTATDLVESDFDVIHLNDVIQERDLYTDVDEQRDSVVVDMDAVSESLPDDEDVIVESHLAHRFDPDIVIVLRCHPAELERRLRERGESAAKAEENAESEALDVILSEAVEAVGMDDVYEIETTDRTPREVADDIESVLAGEREPSAGTVSYIEYLS